MLYVLGTSAVNYRAFPRYNTGGRCALPLQATHVPIEYKIHGFVLFKLLLTTWSYIERLCPMHFVIQQLEALALFRS